VRTMAVARVETTSTGDDFSTLYAAHHAEALRLAYLLCGNTERAEDAVAEAFVRVYRQMRRGEIHSPRAYVRRAVVNEINSRFRRLALERREASKRSGDLRGARSSDDALADTDEMFTALRQLSDRQRTAIVLRFYEDLPEKAIAEAMGVSVGTVKSTLSRGMERLRAVLGSEVAG
jgi:RNA polymerase sigma-70 factor (sigma-E family)